ncbi:hypothetical protein [Halosolutus halophilus]|uniref:hypothetical protein n=1 Tax=Halosolutus halophilus TaxID=1552990 RepID=UPI0022352A38|nr:hypothetical protein [Halosolutus halophilus]
MSENLTERVDELLAEADAASGAALSHESDGADSSGEPSLGETAREASDLVESTDPQELLAAVGLDTLPDGSEPDTIPEAIARGDPEQVDDLKRLLNLANLADRSDDGGLDDAVGSLKESIETGGGTAESSESEDGAASSDEAGAGADSDEAESEDAESGGLEDRVRSSLSDRVADFGDDVSSLQEQLKAAATDATGDGTAGDDEADEDAAADDETGGESAEADDAEDEETADEDGLLGGEQDLRSGPSESSRHSTMAPPPSERADMRAVRRYSTMPDKN